MATAADHPLLAASLEVAVPLWIARVRAMFPEGEPIELNDVSRDALTRIITEHGDDILFRGHKPGDTARAFNALAEALAWMSFAPGGVRFLDRVWESKG